MICFVVTHNGKGGGIAGESDNGDGARGDTKSNEKNGIVGTNASTNPVTRGVPAVPGDAF
jgi:hypothetical protein